MRERHIARYRDIRLLHANCMAMHFDDRCNEAQGVGVRHVYAAMFLHAVYIKFVILPVWGIGPVAQ